jgi:hypothetical protein
MNFNQAERKFISYGTNELWYCCGVDLFWVHSVVVLLNIYYYYT